MPRSGGRRVCVIGAGISGLVTAKVLLEDGFDVTVFEKEPAIGGVWAPSRTYPGLSTNNTRESYGFSDHRYPRDADDFPSAPQVQAYLASYADRFALWPHLRLGTEVKRVARPPGATSGFLVTIDPTEGALETRAFDFVAVCNGTFSLPSMPRVDGIKAFAGRALHSSQLTDPALMEGQRVVVVGAGKSAIDCAAWAAGRARSCTLVFRRPYWMVPRYLVGRVRGEWIVLTRLAESLLRYHRQGRAERLLHGPGRGLVRLAWAGMSRLLPRVLRIPPDLVPGPRLPVGIEQIAVVSDFYDLVREGRIAARKGRVARCAGGTTLELDDGDRLEADLLVFGTGWRQDVGFLDDDLRRRVERDGRFHLYRFILPPGLRDLGFVGWNSSTACQLTSEVGAHWLAACFGGTLSLPSPDEMEHEVARVHRWLAEEMPTRSQGYFIGPHLSHYLDELLADLGLPRRRTSNPLSEYLIPLRPSRYQTVGAERRRARPP
jgi:cation diffusion facilitator CzcD-associated flavoprotein CzcO